MERLVAGDDRAAMLLLRSRVPVGELDRLRVAAPWPLPSIDRDDSDDLRMRSDSRRLPRRIQSVPLDWRCECRIERRRWSRSVQLFSPYTVVVIWNEAKNACASSVGAMVQTSTAPLVDLCRAYFITAEISDCFMPSTICPSTSAMGWSLGMNHAESSGIL